MELVADFLLFVPIKAVLTERWRFFSNPILTYIHLCRECVRQFAQAVTLEYMLGDGVYKVVRGGGRLRCTGNAGTSNATNDRLSAEVRGRGRGGEKARPDSYRRRKKQRVDSGGANRTENHDDNPVCTFVSASLCMGIFVQKILEAIGIVKRVRAPKRLATGQLGGAKVEIKV
jgi:hypothetical protein